MKPRRGFTLIEFILVMTLLATLFGLVAPSLARSLRRRGLRHDVARFVALIEYGRSEAIAQGMPMVIWIDPAARRFGLAPKAGYPARPGNRRDYALDPDVRFELAAAAGSGERLDEAIELGPDGVPAAHSLDAVTLADGEGNEWMIARSAQGRGYEALSPDAYAERNAGKAWEQGQ